MRNACGEGEAFGRSREARVSLFIGPLAFPRQFAPADAHLRNTVIASQRVARMRAR